LQRLDYRGWLQPEVLRAVAAQPGLVEFAARLRAPIDLAPLATAPRLAVIELRAHGGAVAYHPAIGQFAPLAACGQLRRLRLVDCGLDSGAVGELLRRRVTVQAVERL
ncbi:MAG TPA: hypothetical protein VFZ65_14020, partial [Planctomycetota bacterium]|nr:hypothetical protein [Planctomycetota bacterium]